MKSQKEIAQQLLELLRDDLERLLNRRAVSVRSECGKIVTVSRIPYPARFPLQIQITISEEIENANPTD